MLLVVAPYDTVLFLYARWRDGDSEAVVVGIALWFVLMFLYAHWRDGDSESMGDESLFQADPLPFLYARWRDGDSEFADSMFTHWLRSFYTPVGVTVILTRPFRSTLDNPRLTSFLYARWRDGDSDSGGSERQCVNHVAVSIRPLA